MTTPDTRSPLTFTPKTGRPTSSSGGRVAGRARHPGDLLRALRAVRGCPPPPARRPPAGARLRGGPAAATNHDLRRDSRAHAGRPRPISPSCAAPARCPRRPSARAPISFRSPAWCPLRSGSVRSPRWSALGYRMEPDRDPAAPAHPQLDALRQHLAGRHTRVPTRMGARPAGGPHLLPAAAGRLAHLVDPSPPGRAGIPAPAALGGASLRMIACRACSFT